MTTPRFLADEMLGKLARWMRLLGHDVAYARDVSDADLREWARREGRLLLTRDVDCASRMPTPPGVLLVRALDPGEQLEEVARALRLDADPARALSRCSACNVVLDDAVPEDVRDRVPAAILARHDRFWTCASCGRAYWEGTHVDAIRDRIRHLDGSVPRDH